MHCFHAGGEFLLPLSRSSTECIAFMLGFSPTFVKVFYRRHCFHAGGFLLPLLRSSTEGIALLSALSDDCSGGAVSVDLPATSRPLCR
jgi:hypothetical protein